MKPVTSVAGGDKINARIRQIKQRLAEKRVLVGVPEGAGAYEDGTQIAVIAAVNEFGSADGSIPERSFLRVPLMGAGKQLASVFKNSVPEVMDGEITVNAMYDRVGQKAVGIVQEAISAGIDPANAQSTIDAKGSSTPLIDEGTLRQSITYVIDDDEAGE